MSEPDQPRQRQEPDRRPDDEDAGDDDKAEPEPKLAHPGLDPEQEEAGGEQHDREHVLVAGRALRVPSRRAGPAASAFRVPAAATLYAFNVNGVLGASGSFSGSSASQALNAGRVSLRTAEATCLVGRPRRGERGPGEQHGDDELEKAFPPGVGNLLLTPGLLDVRLRRRVWCRRRLGHRPVPANVSKRRLSSAFRSSRGGI